MPCKRIIACLDVRDGRTVKGRCFQNLEDMGDPAEQAVRYQCQGADEIVILDIAASLDSRSTMLDWVEKTAEMLSIPLTAGGGIRTLQDATSLLAAGADKVTVNTSAVENPGLITAIADRYGRQCCVLAVDAVKKKNRWSVLVKGGTEDTGIGVLNWAERVCHLGCGEILLTSWNRDGTSGGFDTDLTRAVSSVVEVPVVASGGAGCPGHFTSVFMDGLADAALAAGILHRKLYTIGDIKQKLLEDGIEVRPC